MNTGKKAKAVLLSVFVACPLVFVRAKPVSGSEFREAAKDAANGTLVLGRHMIFLPKMSLKLKELAQDSVTEADPNAGEDGQLSQDNMYYKSDVMAEDELEPGAEDQIKSNGTWYLINSIDGIEDISTEGEVVNSSVIDQIYLTYHTKEDGVTYDLKTGKAVDIYALGNPYDISALPEVENLKVECER